MNNPIQYSTMVRNLAKPGSAILDSLTPAKCHLIHMLFGLAGEVLELQDAVRRQDKTNIGEEGGDIIFYAQGILNMYDLELSVTPTHHFPSEDRVMHSLILHTEKALDMAKKHVIYNKELSDSLFIDEINNVIRQVLYIGRNYGFTFKDFQDLNMKKLLTGKNARYAAGTYTDEAAQARADKAGDEEVAVHVELLSEDDPAHIQATDGEPGSPVNEDENPPGEDLESSLDDDSEESDETQSDDEEFDPPGDASIGTGL